MDFTAIAGHRVHPADISSLIDANGVHWEVDGINVLAFARDAQCWDIIADVMSRDVAGWLEVFRDCPEDHLLSVLNAYRCFFDESRGDYPDLGVAFPLELWAQTTAPADNEEWLFDQRHEGWLRLSGIVCSTQEKLWQGRIHTPFLSTRRNPPCWVLTQDVLEAFDAGVAHVREYSAFLIAAAARAVAVTITRLDPGVDITSAALAKRLGPYREHLPVPCVVRVHTHFDDTLSLVECHGGGWAVRDDEVLQTSSVGDSVVLCDPVYDHAEILVAEPIVRHHYGAVGF